MAVEVVGGRPDVEGVGDGGSLVSAGMEWLLAAVLSEVCWGSMPESVEAVCCCMSAGGFSRSADTVAITSLSVTPAMSSPSVTAGSDGDGKDSSFRSRGVHDWVRLSTIDCSFSNSIVTQSLQAWP